MKIIFFDTALERFVASLEKQTIAKVLRTIGLLEQFGHTLGMPHSKKIGERLFELRVRGQQEIRILYTFHRGAGVLLHGLIKKSNRIPPKEIRAAYQKLSTLDRV